MSTLGEAMVARLKAQGVEVVFGIPGVHTVELYRGLAASGIRHITPRHEQGAGFMADGYARASGKPGVAFVITGPGLTNTLTPMAQARADSVPMLVVSGVNRTETLGKGLGCLHELPDQIALSKTVSITAQTITSSDELLPAIDTEFAAMRTERGGPHHIEIPLDVAVFEHSDVASEVHEPALKAPEERAVKDVAQRLAKAKRPIILVGGGAKRFDAEIATLAQLADAPVVTTINARGVMHGAPLCIPASASLKSVRDEIEASDCVLALGTEFGPTDYDMLAKVGLPVMQGLVRVDICPKQLARHEAELTIEADVGLFVDALTQVTTDKPVGDGATRAQDVRGAALAELSDDYRLMVQLLDVIRNEIPAALIIGDSTQPIYAGNRYFDHDVPGGWFNAATGFGALGYAIPAAIGAQLAQPERQIVALAGDGGAQFTLSELMTAAQEKLPITFIIWNNGGYGEIELTMERADIDVVGCDPKPPLFRSVAESCGMPFEQVEAEAEALAKALKRKQGAKGPRMVEITAPFIAK